MTKDPRTNGANIRAGADAGTVLVTGAAANATARNAIREVAERVEGVRHLDNQVGVGSNWSW